MALFDVVEAKVFCTNGDQTAVNVLHWALTAHSGTGATGQQMADALDDALQVAIKAAIGTNTRYAGIGVQKIFPLPVGVQTFSVANAGAGAAGTALLPSQVCGMLSFYTGLGGRRQRGRMYVPWPTENRNTDLTGLPDATYVGLLDNLGTALTAGVVAPVGGGANSNTMSLCIWHRATLSYNTVLTYRSRSRWATQRRRGSFGRPNPSPI